MAARVWKQTKRDNYNFSDNPHTVQCVHMILHDVVSYLGFRALFRLMNVILLMSLDVN